jgi:CCR4-NOT transcription complex subunit 3
MSKQMEKFKAVEKEMKTKAFSKEGLSAAAKLDPKEKEKLEICDFLGEMVEELERQIEVTEAEAETLQANMKKGKKDTAKADRIAELERMAERHKWHQGKLELLLRSLENGGVDTDQVKDIEDGIKYYVENNQEVDFMEDDTIYDDLNLDADERMFGLQNEDENVSSQDNQSQHDDTPDLPEPPTKVAQPTPAKLTKQSSVDMPSAQPRRPSVQLKSPLPALATLHASIPSSVNGSAPPGMKPAPLPNIPTGQTLKYASAAAAAAASDKSGVGIAPLPPPPGAPIATARTSSTASPAPTPSQPVAQSFSPAPQPPPQPAKPQESPAKTPSPAQEPAPPAPEPKAKKSAKQAQQPSQDSGVALTNGESSRKQKLPKQQQQQQEPEPEEEEEQEDVSYYHLPESLSDLLESFTTTKERALSANPQVPEEQLLSLSRSSMPTPMDAEKPYHYKPASPYAYTPAHYPQEPLTVFDDPRLYSRIETDTLFYAFYYRQGTYQQFLAAKALKSQSWRFHKQYQTWFQRHEEPKNITEEYEQGTYRFFDYESTWYVGDILTIDHPDCYY